MNNGDSREIDKFDHFLVYSLLFWYTGLFWAAMLFDLSETVQAFRKCTTSHIYRRQFANFSMPICEKLAKNGCPGCHTPYINSCIDQNLSLLITLMVHSWAQMHIAIKIWVERHMECIVLKNHEVLHKIWKIMKSVLPSIFDHYLGDCQGLMNLT